jgi:hypothetical protein
VVFDAGLFHYGVGRMSGFDIAVYGEGPVTVWAIPNFVITLSLTSETAPVRQQDFFDRCGKTRH